MGGRGRGDGPRPQQFAPSTARANTAAATAASAAASPHLLSEQLRGVVKKIEDLSDEFRTYRDRSNQREKVLKADVDVLQSELKVATSKIEFLCGIVGYDIELQNSSSAEQAAGRSSSSGPGGPSEAGGSGEGASGGPQPAAGSGTAPAGMNGDGGAARRSGEASGSGQGEDMETFVAAQAAKEALSLYWRDSKEMQVCCCYTLTFRAYGNHEH